MHVSGVSGSCRRNIQRLPCDMYRTSRNQLGEDLRIDNAIAEASACCVLPRCLDVPLTICFVRY